MNSKLFLTQEFNYVVKNDMADKKMFATRIDNGILKDLKHLSVDTEKPIGTLMEEAVRDLLKKYAKKGAKK